MQSVTTERATLRGDDRRRSLRPQVQATRTRILRAAERLFAERGFDGVSLREIAIAAGQGNNNAVQYHFGSRESLIEEILQARIEEMDAERWQMIADAEDIGCLHDTRTLLTIAATPHLSLCDERGHHPHAGFMLHYLLRRGSEQGRVDWDVVFVQAPAMRRLAALLRTSIDHLPGDIAGTRMTLCAMMFVNLLVRHDAAHPDGADADWLARHMTDTIDAMTLYLRRPCATIG